jgi:hypothetical protein
MDIFVQVRLAKEAKNLGHHLRQYGFNWHELCSSLINITIAKNSNLRVKTC